MKKILNIILAVVLISIVWSCQKEEDQTILAVTNPAKLTVEKNAVVLNEITANEAALNFIWTEPVFNIAVAKTESLEFAKTGSNFTPSVSIDLPAGVTKASVTHLQINNMAAALGLNPDIAGKIQVRLKTALNNTFFYSDPIEITVTPYKPNPDLVYSKIFVPGNYGAASGFGDWGGGPNDPSQVAPALYSPNGDGKYFGFLSMNVAAPEFKFTKGAGWDNNKGDIAENPNSFTTLVDNGKNIKTTEGNTNFYIKVDWAANTYSVVKANFGVIGEATPTGWNSDTKLTFNTTTHKFEIPSIALAAGKAFKFRANDDWQIKIQPTGKDQQLASGQAVQTFTSLEKVDGDASYTVAESGNYKIELDLHNSAFYSIKVTKL